MAIENPKYSVIVHDGAFEVRDYVPSIVAVVHVSGPRDEAVNAGFRVLAGYIFGSNQTQQKISMTAPVTQNAGETIAMQTPLESAASQTGWEVCFTMPAALTLNSLPKPQKPQIQLIQREGRRMAVVTFSGFWSDSNFQSHQGELSEFLKKRELTAIGPPVYAYYDPPWTPWFLRTNEVQVRIAPRSAP